jgi:hypothetical protein
MGLALFCFSSAGAFAQDESEPAVEPAARARVAAAFERIQGATQFSFGMRRLYDVVQESGQKLQFGTIDTLLVRRPDRTRATMKRDDGQTRELHYDGENLTVLDVGENAWAQFAVPPTLDQTLDFLELEVGSPMPLADLLYEDLGSLLDAAQEGASIGTATIGDLICEHLAFRGERLDWQIWIDQDNLIRKIVITDPDSEAQPQIGARFLSWNFDAEAPDEAFEFVAPEGSERIPTLARPAAFLDDEEEEG